MITEQNKYIIKKISEFLLIYFSLTLLDLSIDSFTLSISLIQTRVLFSIILLGLFNLKLKERLYASIVIFIGLIFYSLLNADDLSKEFLLVGLVFFIPLIIDKEIFEKINLKVILLSVLFLTFYLQQFYLGKEIISWDISTYLSMGQDINRGNIPFESQYSLKAVLCFYIFSFIDLLSNGDYRIVKILNDIPLLILITIMFFTIQLKLKKVNTVSSILLYSSLLFIEYYGATAYTEHFTLIPIAIAFYLIERNKESNYFFIGILFSLSTLINHGSAVLFLSALAFVIFNKKDQVIKFLFGFSIPHFGFLFFYYINELLRVYLIANLQIPLNYTSLPLSEKFEDMYFGYRGFFIGLSNFNTMVLAAVVLVIALILFNLIPLYRRTYSNNAFTSINYFLVGCAIHLFIVGHAPVRHNFFIYFFCLCLVNISEDLSRKLVLPIVIIASLSVLTNHYEKPYENIQKFESLEDTYLFYRAAESLKTYHNADSSSTVLALNSQLILYYLDIPNSSYVNHPAMIFVEEVNVFDDPNNKTEEDVFRELMLSNPDFVICPESSFTFCNEINGYSLIDGYLGIFKRNI